MSIKVYIRENFVFSTVDIWVAETGDGRRAVLRPDGQWFVSTDSSVAAAEDEPSYRLREDVARPLLDALVRFYDGGEDTRALRRDYDAERGRVDKMIAVVAGLAERALPGPIPS